MPSTQPIYPHRILRVPNQFSWVDGRLLRDHHLDRCSYPAAALYLFLVTVADAQGLSYCSDQSISRRLIMDSSVLTLARLELIQYELIAFKQPLCQILDLSPPELAIPEQHNQPWDSPQSIGQILKQIMEADS